MARNYISWLIFGGFFCSHVLTAEGKRRNNHWRWTVTSAEVGHLACVHCTLGRIPTWKTNSGIFVPGSIVLDQVQILTLDFNEIRHVHDGAFSDLPNLLTLSLKSNKVASFGKKAFAGLENLTELTLSSNKLTRINLESFRNLKKLRRLRLDCNMISQFVGNWSISLDYLDLGNNLLGMMPPLPGDGATGHEWSVNLRGNQLYCKCRRNEHDQRSLTYNTFCRISSYCLNPSLSKLTGIDKYGEYKRGVCPLEAWRAYVEGPVCRKPSIKLRVRRVPTRRHLSYVTCMTSGIPPPSLLLARKRPTIFTAYRDPPDGSDRTTLIVGPFRQGLFQCKGISPIGNVVSEKMRIRNDAS